MTREEYATAAFHVLLGTVPELAPAQREATSRRAARAWLEKTAGYRDTPVEHATTTFVASQTTRGMVVVRDIEIESLCEHHLERVWGYAHIGYIPIGGRVLGLSKFTRIANAFARRLQLQERLTAQIADMLMDALMPQGVGVVLEARHSCMETRGITKRGQITTTSELRGVFYDDATTRSEFLALARASRPF